MDPHTEDIDIAILAQKEMIGDGINIETMDICWDHRFYFFRQILPPLQERGYKVRAFDWRDQTVQWDKVKLIVFGPIWDYCFHTQEIMQFLRKIKTLQIPCLNNIDFILWNINKQYILEMDGIFKLPKTIPIMKPEDIDVALQEFKQDGIKQVVCKGLFDNNGVTVKKYDITDDTIEQIKDKCKILIENNNGAFIQEYVECITENGEFSYYCHYLQKGYCFVKVPMIGEFKIQDQYGGKKFHYNLENIEEVIPEIKKFNNQFQLDTDDIKHIETLFDQALLKTKAFFENKGINDLMYLRFDFVMRRNQNGERELVLMEIEGIEPYLQLYERNLAFPNETNWINNFIDSIEMKYLMIKQEKENEKEYPDNIVLQFDDTSFGIIIEQQTIGTLVQKGQTMKKYDVFKYEYPTQEELKHSKAIIIGGSLHSAYEDLQWLKDAKEWIAFVYKTYLKIKFIGLCFGHQVIAESLGGRVERSRFVSDDGLPYRIGVETVTFTQSFYEMRVAKETRFKDKESIGLFTHHGDEVTQLPSNALLLASSRNFQNEMYTIPDRVLCTQTHPEFSDDLMKWYVNSYMYQQKKISLEQRDKILDEIDTIDKTDQYYFRDLLKAFINLD